MIAEIIRVRIPVLNVLIQQVLVIPTPHPLPSHIHKTPLTPTVVERVVVPLAREVDPLYASRHVFTPTGMSELVPHEVQIALAAQHFGEQPNQMEHVDAL